MNRSLRAEQINHYYPYGLTFADAGKGAGVQPYKYGGKELDAMYGLYWSDFGARHLSPYLYCANNPFNFIDPDGRDYYGVDNLGAFSLISVNDDLTDRIFKLDQNRKPLGDTFVDVEKDFMSSLYGEDVKLDSEIYGMVSGHVDVNTMTSSTDKVFEFLVKNTDVEWSQVNTIAENGSTKNYIGTSHNDSMDGSLMFISSEMIEQNLYITDANHSHPSGFMVISDGDVNCAKYIQDRFPNASMKIYSPFDYDNPMLLNKNSIPRVLKEIIFEVPKTR